MNNVDYDRMKRRTFNEIKGWSNARFWDWMNKIHSGAYFKAVGHYKEAAEVVLPPRLQQPLHDKALEIRETWDGIREVTLDLSHLELSDILYFVSKEMERAAKIHGDAFNSLAEAREAIDEEYAEVWEAVNQRDFDHAKEEAVQLIGVLVKLIWFLREPDHTTK